MHILEVINLGISDHEPLILTLKENKIKRGHDIWSTKNCHTKEYTNSINAILDQDMSWFDTKELIINNIKALNRSDDRKKEKKLLNLYIRLKEERKKENYNDILINKIKQGIKLNLLKKRNKFINTYLPFKEANEEVPSPYLTRFLNEKRKCQDVDDIKDINGNLTSNIDQIKLIFKD